MMEFPDIAAFLRHMERSLVRADAAGSDGLRRAALMVEREAKAEIGHYQEADGPFPAWEPLSQATLEGFHHPAAGWIPGKVELGYAPPDNPLLRDGWLRESIGSTVEGHEAAAGSDDEVAVWQELGTPNAMYPIPPRSFLGRAGVKKQDAAVDTMAGGVVAALASVSRAMVASAHLTQDGEAGE